MCGIKLYEEQRKLGKIPKRREIRKTSEKSFNKGTFKEGNEKS